MKKLFLLVFLPLLIIACTENAAIKTDAQETVVMSKSSLSFNSIENMIPNGDFTISIYTPSGWNESGTIFCDKFYRELNLNVPAKLTSDIVRIRITQNGGGAAHLDSVRLNENPPLSVSGVDNSLLKLLKSDNDVLDVSKKTIECIFKARGMPAVLTVRARIENEVFDTSPINLPETNLMKEPWQFRDFYHYTAAADKSLGIKEYCLSGSGHPDGYVYLNITDDYENLKIDIDLTPDNTMDGGLDYAKVYLKTKKGLKSFRITTEKSSWGNTEFIYTDKVEYQHKTYNFKIPFAEAGISSGDSVDIAFSLYGTVSTVFYQSDIAFNTAANNFLAVYQRESGGDWNIYGQLLNTDGTESGSEFLIDNAAGSSCTHPQAAYNATDNNYLVVWEDRRTSGSSEVDIYGQIVPADGVISILSNFIIDNDVNNQLTPDLSWDSINNRYLSVFMNYDISDYSCFIYGQLITSGGSRSGSRFAIDSAEKDQWDPNVVFNPTEAEYLVTWYTKNESDAFICGNLVSAAGTPSATKIFSIGTNWTKSYPAAAYNRAAGNYLVVWREYDWDDNPDILGRIVGADGTASGAEIVIGDLADAEMTEPDIVYDAYNNNYLVIWRDNRGTDYDIYGRRVTAAGTMPEADFTIDVSAGIQALPSLAINPYCQNYIASYMDNSWDPTTISFVSGGSSGCVWSAPVPVYPSNGATGLSYDLTFIWEEPSIPTLQTAAAKLYIGTDEAFTGVTPVEIAGTGAARIRLAGIGILSSFLTAGVFLRKRAKGKHGLIKILVVLLSVTGLILAACAPPDNPPTVNTGETSYQLTGLTAGTTYYWKVAYEFSIGITTESPVWSFTTF
ncbi:MAG: hypothetical protein JEZ04_06895 [Spirochaetales bacterium]|nr:hypothetical protein [Spirochaetales bacterium]